MKSPFPGMDPYLEQHWLDVHARLVLYACDQLEDQLPGSLIARVEERVVFETEESSDHWIYPDVRVFEASSRSSAKAAALSRTSASEPFIVPYHSEPATETFIQILDPKSGNRLVTVIEVLSLANKLPGKGQRDYRRKQSELQEHRVNLVEIDLLRRGNRVLLLPFTRIPRHVRTTYQACVWRASKPDQCEVYRAPLRSPLPTIRIPLRSKDKDIRLDLQAIIDLAYRKGRYRASIDYDDSPDPPLPPTEAKWARAVVKKASGKRT
jgi:hypothetical protein